MNDTLLHRFGNFLEVGHGHKARRLRITIDPPDHRPKHLAAQLDNLGKGAAGAAVQNMNIMLGLDEAAGLD